MTNPEITDVPEGYLAAHSELEETLGGRAPNGRDLAGLRRVVIVHGFGGYPEKHWYPWLANELVSAGLPVTRVALPSPKNPDRAEWERALEEQVGSVDDAIVVAHSLGCVATISHIEHHPEDKPRGLVFVTAFDKKVEAIPEVDGFVGEGADSDGVARRTRHVAIVHSDEDPVVPIHNSQEMAKRWEAAVEGTDTTVRTVEVPGAKHFLFGHGVTEVPEVRDLVMEMLD